MQKWPQAVSVGILFSLKVSLVTGSVSGNVTTACPTLFEENWAAMPNPISVAEGDT